MKPSASKIVIGKPKVNIVDSFPEEPRCFGEAYKSEFLIKIRKNSNSKSYLDTLIHELLHCILPDASETKIKQITRILVKEIWAQKYRRTKQKD